MSLPTLGWVLLGLALLAAIAVVLFWPSHGEHQAPADTRPPQQRWEDGPARRAPPGGSMIADHELAGRSAYRGRCDDTGEHHATVVMPRVEDRQVWYGDVKGPSGPPAFFCPRCEASDDQPHYIGCPFYDADEAALFTLQLGDLGERVTLRTRNLDPAAWRPYLSAEEFAETFPGVPYELDSGPHTGDLMAIDDRLADQLAALDAETRDWLHQRAAAHAEARARLIMAWQAVWQPGA